MLKIVKGEDKTWEVTLPDETCKDKDLDLTGATEITAVFEKTDGTTLSVTMTGAAITVVAAKAGRISITLSDTNTALLKARDDGSYEIAVDIGAVKKIFQFEQELEIVERLFT